MSLLKSSLIKASGNRFIQGVCERNVQALQFLMGIGSGSDVSSSGERAIFRLLKNRVTPPYCVFDVGSNVGQFLHLTLENIGDDDKSRIHCFEPGHKTFRMLANSVPQDTRVRLNNLGIGREPGEALLHFDTAGSGLASLTERRLTHFGIGFQESESVTLTSIDSYCSDNNIDHIHLLKIDIEGHELDALAGARTMFDRRSIDVVALEFGGCNIDTRTFFQDFWYFFANVDMKIFRITPSGYLHPITSYKESHEQFRTTNFIAVSSA